MDQKTDLARTDIDAVETQEWLEALQSVLERDGPERAHFLLDRMVEVSRRAGALLPFDPTTEYINGRAVTVQASFRAYPDAQSAFRDYVDFIGQNPRYREALAHGANAGQYARHLERAGYATDPNYANKIMAILSGDGFDGLADEGAGVSN